MRDIFFTILFLLFCCSLQAQQINTISSRCPSPYRQDYSSVRADVTGNITFVPCPTIGTNIFSGTSDFSNSTINTPFRLVDKNYLNFQSVPSYFSIGNVPSNPITLTKSLYVADIELELRGDVQDVVGLFTRNTVSSPTTTTSADSIITGVYSVAYNPFDLNPNRTLYGVHGIAYNRGVAATTKSTIGGLFEAYTGGGAGGGTFVTGVHSIAMGGHNGTTPRTVGGRFVISNLGGGGVGNLTEAIGVWAQFQAGAPVTNYIEAKGLALQGWEAASGGSYTNSYGIYADTSIDRGTNSRYFIYSLSASPSLFSGVVRVAQDVYVTDNTKGMVLKSPDGTCYRFTVANGGTLNAGASITCP